jgi:hypothetical protein
MFTHPSLLRQLKATAEHLRRAGEMDWARRVVQAGDHVRKSGWTAAGKKGLDALFAGDGALDAVSFGVEHERRLGGPVGVGEANQRLSELRLGLKDLGSLPLRAEPNPDLPVQRSPDLV